MPQDLHTDVLIIGAGTAGGTAMSAVQRAGLDFRIVDHGPLGSTCARVGCMPSKAALQAGARWQAGHNGAAARSAQEEWARARQLRDDFAQSTAADTRRAAGDQLIPGQARFVEPTRVQVQQEDQTLTVEARTVIIATGSHPVLPDFLDPVREHVVTTDTLFDLAALPPAIAVLGLGAVGLEMSLALARLGVRITGVDTAAHLAGIAHPDLAARAAQRFGKEIDLWLNTHAQVERGNDGVRLTAPDRHADAPLLLAALGRRPNLDDLGLHEAGFALDEHGLPQIDPHTLQVGELPVYLAGDASNERPLLHEAIDQGAIAGYNAAHLAPLHFARKVALRIVFSDPDIFSVGRGLNELDRGQVITGRADAGGNGRAIILDATDGLLHIHADAVSGRLLGAEGFAAGGEHLAHLLAWAIQRGETAKSLLTMPFYHPTMEELVQTALKDIVRNTPSDAVDPLPYGLEFMD